TLPYFCLKMFTHTFIHHQYIEHTSEYIDVSTQRIDSSTTHDKKERHIVKKSTYGTAPVSYFNLDIAISAA
ncbi:hypothetical protein ACFDTO_12615, partial [Microbacteriaceae bacterium 4G12]